MKSILVDLKKNSYKVFIGSNIFSESILEIKKNYSRKKIAVIVDEYFYNLWKETINKNIRVDEYTSYFILHSGEKSKSGRNIEKIFNHLIEKQFGRDSLVIALGGGVTGDAAGYAASTFMRGIDYIQIPTTLLASVDSSVGGKTGINFGQKKNIIGTFHQPKAVYIDISFLKTLPDVEIVCGLGEVVKYSFLTNKKFYDFIINNFHSIKNLEKEFIEKIICECVSFKSGVVSKDERETTGVRKILNLGHTFAHAYESEMNFSIKHGHAVLAGLVSASFLSHKMKLISDKTFEEYLFLLSKFEYPKKLIKLSNNSLYNVMLSDKKNQDGRIKFILSAGFAKTITDVEVEKSFVIEVLNEAKKLIK